MDRQMWRAFGIMNENVDVNNPSTMLKMHPDVTVIIDRPLADLVGYTD